MPSFDKDLKKLAKKYKSLKEDFKKLKEEIEENPLLGTDLGEGFKKIRINITSKAQGKRGGGRVITHEVVVNVNTLEETKNILFVALYDKSENESVNMKIIKEVVQEYYDEE